MKNFTKENLFGFIVGVMSIAITIVAAPIAIMAIHKYSIISMDFLYADYVVYAITFLTSIGIAIDSTGFMFSMFTKNENSKKYAISGKINEQIKSMNKQMMNPTFIPRQKESMSNENKMTIKKPD